MQGVPPARQALQVDRLAVVQRFGDGGEAAQLGMSVPPDRGFENADTAAEENTEAVARRRLEPAHQHVAAEAAQGVDRDQARAQREAEIARRLPPRARASSTRARSMHVGGTSTTAPSPPNRKGMRTGAQRCRRPAMPMAATKLTVLWSPLAIAPVESTMSVTASAQSPGAGRQPSGSKVSRSLASRGSSAKKPAAGGDGSAASGAWEPGRSRAAQCSHRNRRHRAHCGSSPARFIIASVRAISCVKPRA